jgi:DNA-binding transcriptional LysR family regulator
MLAMQPLGDLWQVLDRAPMALVPDRLPSVSLCDHVAHEEKMYTLAAVGGDATHFNSGLILWRSEPATDCLFEHWHQQWRRFARQDQLALVRAIASTGIQVAVLPSSYNTSPRDARGKPVHLLHCWGDKVQRGIFRRFAAVHCPAAVQEAQRRLQALDRGALAL